MKKIFLITVILIILTSVLSATSLEKRHALSFEIGIWAQTTDLRTEIGSGGIETTVDKNGLLASMGYSHWLQENLALNFEFKAQALDLSTNISYTTTNTETSVVSSMLLGFKYYFLKSTMISSIRPFLKIGLGPYIGEQSKESVGTVLLIENRTEIAFGTHAGFGVDIITGRHFMLGINSGYNFMTDFTEPIGGSKNYSGPEFGFSFSWLFGKGVSN